jgi:hypothetical protein
MTPAHRSRERRWLVLVFVVGVIAVVALVAGSRSPAPATAPSPSSLVGAPDAESSAWYCTGQSSESGVAPGELVLTNTTAVASAGTVTEVSDTGAAARTAVAIPAHGVVVPRLDAPKSGSWLSQEVTISGGGVAVSQAVRGSSGWSESPCQSLTSSSWFFPGGTTAGSAKLFVSLFNPTSTPVVVDLAFATPSGVVHPLNYQGIVLPPDGLQVEDVASEVQDFSAVSTVVRARTGRVVVSEVQVRAGAPGGLSVLPGAPRAQAHWTVPQAEEVAGGSSQLDVFNPGPSAETVTVHLRLASGPLHSLGAKVGPNTTWDLATSAQTRIPSGDPYTVRVDANGGAGVVVGRLVVAPASAHAPQLGLSNAVDGSTASAPERWWVLPPPGTAALPAKRGATPEHVALTNVSGAAEHYRVDALDATGRRLVWAGSIPADTTAALSPAQLQGVGLEALLVHATGPMAVLEDVGPTGTYGVVAMPGIPLGEAIGN